MGRINLVLAAALACAALAAGDRALAQRAAISRPSDQGASSRIGRVGGAWTYQAPRNRNQPGPVATATPGFGRPSAGNRGGSFIRPMRFGLVASPQSPALLSHGVLSSGAIGGTSGFYRSTAVTTPLYGHGDFLAPRTPGTPIFSLSFEGTPHQELFGLRPADTSAGPPAIAEHDAVLDEINARTDTGVGEMRRRALGALKDATTEDLSRAEQLERLAVARRLLDGVRKLDQEDSLAPLLLAHIHLERMRGAGMLSIDTALFNLQVVASRNPELFADGTSVRGYFGDYDEQTGTSRVLEQQMRYYARAARTTTGLNSQILEAYCALVLGDTARARAALDQADEGLRMSPEATHRYDQLVAALRYAL